MIIRQSSLGVSICPMLAWKREGEGLEFSAWGLGFYLLDWTKEQCRELKTPPRLEYESTRAGEFQDARGAEAESTVACLSRQQAPAWICMLRKQLVLLGKARSVVGPGLRLPVFGKERVAPARRKEVG